MKILGDTGKLQITALIFIKMFLLLNFHFYCILVII